MNEEIRKKLERRVGRRTFLKGSGLAAAGIIGVAAASSVGAFQDKPRDQKRDDPPSQNQEQNDQKKNDQKDNEAKDDKKRDSTQDAEQDPYKVTRTDDKGREYRICPVCGSNMYRQDRIWTCENCGYSYEE